MGQKVVYPLETETQITKQTGSGGGQEANKIADEGQGPSATGQPQISISANTGFLFRYHHQRDPGPMSEDADGERVFFQSRKVRWSILAAYWAVILLALPLWWTTTSIQRLALPTSRVEDLSRNGLRFPVDIVLDPSSGVDTKALSGKVQSLINARLGPDVRTWLDVHVHPHPIPREFPATYCASPTPNKQETQARMHMWSSSMPVLNIQKCRGAASSLLVTDVRANPFDTSTRSHVYLQLHPRNWQTCLSTC